jgi:hypothetical protein
MNAGAEDGASPAKSNCSGSPLYSEGEIDGLPEDAVLASLG